METVPREYPIQSLVELIVHHIKFEHFVQIQKYTHDILELLPQFLTKNWELFPSPTYREQRLHDYWRR